MFIDPFFLQLIIELVYDLIKDIVSIFYDDHGILNQFAYCAGVMNLRSTSLNCGDFYLLTFLMCILNFR